MHFGEDELDSIEECEEVRSDLECLDDYVMRMGHLSTSQGFQCSECMQPLKEH